VKLVTYLPCLLHQRQKNLSGIN